MISAVVLSWHDRAPTCLYGTAPGSRTHRSAPHAHPSPGRERPRLLRRANRRPPPTAVCLSAGGASLGQAAVGVVAVVGDLRPEPVGRFKRAGISLGLELDLGDHESL